MEIPHQLPPPPPTATLQVRNTERTFVQEIFVILLIGHERNLDLKVFFKLEFALKGTVHFYFDQIHYKYSFNVNKAKGQNSLQNWFIIMNWPPQRIFSILKHLTKTPVRNSYRILNS